MSDLKQLVEREAVSTNKPIPGSSLTNDPKNPAAFEQPPRFVDVHMASEYMWVKMVQPEAYVGLMQTLDQGVPVMTITQALLTDGFQNGLWNPDLMLMLIEPVAYMLIALAERADIDIVVYQGQLNDEDETEQILGVSFEEERIRNMVKASEVGSIPENIVTPEMKKDLESLPTDESLLAAPSPEETTAPQQESLMAPPQA